MNTVPCFVCSWTDRVISDEGQAMQPWPPIIANRERANAIADARRSRTSRVGLSLAIPERETSDPLRFSDTFRIFTRASGPFVPVAEQF
jgi:hypothetical protein